MWLIAGLGNPGAEYALTRHNIGFIAVDVLADGATFTQKFHGETATVPFGGEKLVLLKPLTYMNLSGKSVLAAMQFYKLPPERLIVIHDELDLPLGKIRVKQGGGANGHNGIKDIDALIGVDYWRVRMGIGHPGRKTQVHNHVLGRFGVDEMPMLEKVLVAFGEHLPLFWQHSPAAMMSKISAALHEPEKPEKA